VRILLLLLFLFASITSFSAELKRGDSYRLGKGRIETVTGEIIPNGTLIRIEKVEGWAVTFRVLNQNLEPIGPVHKASVTWVQTSIVELELDDVINTLANISTMAKAPEIQQACPPEEKLPLTITVRPRPRPTPTPTASISTPLEISIRPKERPNREAASSTPSAGIKRQADIEKYFACYQKSPSLTSTYQDSYKNSLRIVSDAYKKSTNISSSTEDINTIMSCLIFRESAHWDGGPSHTGAVGLGQFTSIAINQVKDIITYKGVDNFDDRIAIQRSEHRARRLKEADMKKNIAFIEAERKKHRRMVDLKKLWDSIPLKSRPKASEVNSTYLAKNSNHEAVIAMSSLLMRDCQIRLAEGNYNLTHSQSLLACAGSYNMGVGGFSSTALSRKGAQSLSAWVENLSKSNHSQKNETINHVISIYRCQSKDKNYPPCGTQVDYCSDLASTNPCQDNVGLLCVGECRR
jgi:hypothetical protein